MRRRRRIGSTWDGDSVGGRREPDRKYDMELQDKMWMRESTRSRKGKATGTKEREGRERRGLAVRLRGTCSKSFQGYDTGGAWYIVYHPRRPKDEVNQKVEPRVG